MIRDICNNPIQVFAPKRMQAVTGGVEWEPRQGDVAFSPSVDCAYSISGGQAVDLYRGEVRGIVPGCTYTFSLSQHLEVM